MIKQQHRFLTAFFLVLSLLSAQWVLADHVHEHGPLHQHVSDCTLCHHSYGGDHALPVNGELPLQVATGSIQYATTPDFHSEEHFAHFQGRAPPFLSL